MFFSALRIVRLGRPRVTTENQRAPLLRLTVAAAPGRGHYAISIMNTEAKIARVLPADDHAEVLTQTSNVLAGEFEIVGSVANGVAYPKSID